MARRNIASRGDIDPDALRQRRDMYVLAIGLMVFNLAGGSVGAETSFSGVLPVKLMHPWVLVAAAWIGLLYFWFRFWLVTKAKPWYHFASDVSWQAGNSQRLREVAAELVSGPAALRQRNQNLVMSPNGPVPKVYIQGWQPRIGLQNIKPNGASQHMQSLGPGDCEIPNAHRWKVWKIIGLSVPRAMVYERTFTDYTLPHLFAIVTVLVGLLRLIDRL